MTFQASELVLNNKGQVYHLGLFPEDIADKIILVGDQARVNLVSSFFTEITHRSQHREFVCHTGIYANQRISVLSTGIGTDNIDIVMNELDVLANIDLATQSVRPNPKPLEIIRIGTCGMLRSELPIHQFVLSEMSLGLDNVAHYYDIHFTQTENELLDEIRLNCPFPPKIEPYLISADKGLTERLKSVETANGITLTASGFYGPQGRALRLPLKNSWREHLENTSFQNVAVLNFEMESSALFAIGRSLGHACATICLGIANRPSGQFSRDYSREMQDLIRYVLDRF